MVNEQREHEDDHEPPATQTSPSLTGGAPPIPPHNGPPQAVATGSGEDEPEPVINVLSEPEALAAIRGQGYKVQKITVKKPHPRPAERPGPFEKFREMLQGFFAGLKK